MVLLVKSIICMLCYVVILFVGDMVMVWLLLFFGGGMIFIGLVWFFGGDCLVGDGYKLR